jgi:hypothetical protein
MGVLCEPQFGYVAHTPLSAQFLKRPSFLDGLLCTTENVIPAALNMGNYTRPERERQHVASIGAQNTPHAFASRPTQRETGSKLQRRALPFNRIATVKRMNAIIELVSSRDWEALGDATVVEVR